MTLLSSAIPGTILLSRETFMFGWLKKKAPQTALDAIIRAMYGNPPPPKTASLEDAIQIASNELLGNLVSREEVGELGHSLYSSPIPYSTNDLAASIALHFFRQPERLKQLEDAQLMARLVVGTWAKQEQINLPLAAAFEGSLYERYKPGVAVSIGEE